MEKTRAKRRATVDDLGRLIAAEIEALRGLEALLGADPLLLPSALALEVARCNRRRQRTIEALEAFAGHSLRRVTPPSLQAGPYS